MSKIDSVPRAEEELLTRELGEGYRRYAAAVPALVPRFRGRRPPPTGKS